ncbi:hypothetical protein BOO25_11245 [Vibrio navarrensis]|uniref:hypothetical protein n=1 Tax=Vibrio navarrensis TaxID=29495 RepID=UPI001EE3FEEC|nr:hypothetical protein [Vibrio navarrensis]MBE3669501.1 hypothetical protein [Vibrio navarrensis]
MVEIGGMNQQSLNRRIGSWEQLHRELKAWESMRNGAKASIEWLFDVDNARKKLHWAYDELTIQN